MMNRDTFFKKREEPVPRNVNVTPALGTHGHPADPTARPANPLLTPAQTSPTASTPERAKSAAGTGSKLIVGPDIKLKGAEITDCDTLVVEGTVEAAMDSRVVQIAENGVFNGTVSIDIAEIHGRFDGELTARDVSQIAQGAALKTKKGFSVFVTDLSTAAWFGLDPVPAQ